MKLKYRLNNLKYDIKWKFQRAFHGYSDSDVWDIDIWFLNIMPKMLKRLKETAHGHPASLTEQEWSDILDRMIFLLTEMDEDTCSYKNPYQEEYDTYLLERFNCTDGWKSERDKELYRKWLGEEENKFNHMKLCKKEFFELFSKYFENLWD